MVKMRVDTVVAVTPQIAHQLKLFGVAADRMRIILEHEAFESFDLVNDALTHKIEIETVVSSRTFPSPLFGEDEMNIADRKMRSLRVLSLFSGCGGLDRGLAGMDGKCGFKTKWAIDSTSNSIETLKGHMPSTVTFALDVSIALERMQILPGMPKKGEVDVILMGTPCEPFSFLNRFRNTQEGQCDPRSLLIATSMSYMDVYRPPYGVIENVCGMLIHGDCGNVKKIGIIRFIRACLIGMGYNVRFCKVQCGFYGIPQHRWRVKIIFARKGLTLPLAPCPTTRMAGCGSAGGPGDAVTIEDATSDLARWEFRNPHIIYEKELTLKDSRPQHKRPAQYQMKEQKTIGLFRSQYAHSPQNEFQRSVRPTNSEIVFQHQTLPMHIPGVERIWNIPFSPGANHLSLLNGHARLALNSAVELEDENSSRKAYGRLDSNGVFDIVTSNYVLETKHGRMLMPDQNRTPTLRELARAQGFPDPIYFHGSPNQIVRQIGNSVPIPLGRAIGKSIRDAAIQDYLNGDRRFARSSSI